MTLMKDDLWVIFERNGGVFQLLRTRNMHVLSPNKYGGIYCYAFSHGPCKKPYNSADVWITLANIVSMFRTL